MTGCNVQWHVEECGGTWWYAMIHDATQWALGALPLGRLMDRDSRCTIGCSSPKIDEDIVKHLGTPYLVEAGPQGGYQQIRGRERVIRRITLAHYGRLLIILFGTCPPIILQCCLQSQRVWLFPFDTLHSGNRAWEAHPNQLDETPRVMG